MKRKLQYSTSAVGMDVPSTVHCHRLMLKKGSMFWLKALAETNISLKSATEETSSFQCPIEYRCEAEQISRIGYFRSIPFRNVLVEDTIVPEESSLFAVHLHDGIVEGAWATVVCTNMMFTKGGSNLNFYIIGSSRNLAVSDSEKSSDPTRRLTKISKWMK